MDDELSILVKRLADPRLEQEDNHGNIKDTVDVLMRRCGVHEDDLSGVRYDLTAAAARQEMRSLAPLVPILMVMAFLVQPQTRQQRLRQEELVSDDTYVFISDLSIDPAGAARALTKIANDPVLKHPHKSRDANYQHVREMVPHPVNDPKAFKNHMARFGKTFLSPPVFVHDVSEWHEDQIILGVHMALSLRQIMLSTMPMPQRTKALDLWRHAFSQPELAQVESLILPLVKHAEHVVTKKLVPLDRMLKVAHRLDVLPHRNRRLPVQPYYI